MALFAVIGALAAAASCSTLYDQTQVPLFGPLLDDHYTFAHSIKTAAIIGAGPGGLNAAEALRDAGIQFRLFERDTVPGGVWHYTDEIPLKPSYKPLSSPAEGDYVPLLPPHGVQLPCEHVLDEPFDDLRRAHRAPRPVWKGLHSNAPAPSQQFASWPWLVGTPWEASHTAIGRYVRSYASFLSLNSNDDSALVSYNTRVELAEKIGQKWRLTLSQLSPHGAVTKVKWWSEEFDALVVANGRYNSPNIPQIPGLADWAARWPDQIHHGREYRTPEPFTNKTVLILGVSVSGSEISREISTVAKKLYQSVRERKPTNDTLRIPLYDRKIQMSRVPKSAIVVGEIERFLPSTVDNLSQGVILLKNGTEITGVDHLIFASGYYYALPFLPQLHNSTIRKERDVETDIAPVITDGTHVRSLHLDVFYIPDPTLAFVNRNEVASDFVFGEYITVAIAKVWSGTGKLPSIPDMWRIYKQRVEDRGGYTPTFNFIYSKAVYRQFIGWINHDSALYGGRQVDEPPSWRSEMLKYWGLARFGIGSATTAPSIRAAGEELYDEMVSWA